jgi:PAS domain S-box-containing protein
MFSADFYKRLCEQASIGIVIADAEFRISMLNSTAAVLFDVDPREAKDQPVEILVPANRRNITKKLMQRAVAVAKPLEYRVRRVVEGKKRYLSIVADPILREGRVEGVCLWIQDLTRRMEMEKRMSEIEKLASLGQMAGGLAHHFNNVLGGIVTSVDHALVCDDPATSRKTLEMISDGIGKAVVLTRKLLQFSTPELPEKNLVDLTEAVITFVEKAEPRLSAAGRQIELELKTVPIRAVHPGKMRQVLEALLANSEQAFGPRGGKIKITLEADARQVRLLFHDDGPGIPNLIADRIFEPFFTTRGSMGGGAEENLGLGLTLARRLAEDIGGSLLYCADTAKLGASFALTFPLSK